MLAPSASVIVLWWLTVAVVSGERHLLNPRRPRRTATFNSQQQQQQQQLQPQQQQLKSTNDDNSLQNDPNSGLHNILPNYRTPAKYCYQCAYSPPRTYSSKEKQSSSSKAGNDGLKTVGGRLAIHGGTSSRQGGWDKCLGPFDELQAAEYGVDVWQCHSNCYTRRDPNGDIFRGCFKGEYGVDPSLDGCHYQAGSIYCFCDSDRCNNGAVPSYRTS